MIDESFRRELGSIYGWKCVAEVDLSNPKKNIVNGRRLSSLKDTFYVLGLRFLKFTTFKSFINVGLIFATSITFGFQSDDSQSTASTQRVSSSPSLSNIDNANLLTSPKARESHLQVPAPMRLPVSILGYDYDSDSSDCDSVDGVHFV